MFIVESYPLAIAMCVITMLCWGSWANTQKLASKEWRFQLFYWDYAIGVFLLALLLAFTLGSSGGGGRGFLADLQQADSHWLGSAFLGGVIFNLSNILLVAAIDIAGLAVAFPVGVGLALVLGVITTYLSTKVGNAPMLGLGRGGHHGGHHPRCAGLQAPGQRRPENAGQGHRHLRRGGRAHGLFLQVSSRRRWGKSIRVTKALEAGKLSPYTAIVLFSAGLLLSNFLWNSIMMVKPFTGAAGALRRLLHQRQRSGCTWSASWAA